MLAYAQASGAIAKANAVKPGQVMTQEDFSKLPASLEARGTPDGSGNILVTSMSNRAPVVPVAPVSVSAGGGTLVDTATGATRIIPAIPQADPGYMLEGNIPAGPQAAPATTISPEVLAKFAPPSRMAPSTGGLLAQTGPQSTPTVSPQTAEAIRAVQSQAALAGPTPATPSGIRMTVIPGSKAAQETQSKRQSEISSYQLQMQNFDTVIDAIDKVLPNVNAQSTGLGSLLKHVPTTKANQVAADLRPILAQTAFQGLAQLKEAGLTLGQIAIYEIKLLENARLALNQEGSAKDFADSLKNLKKTTQNSQKRLEILARDRKAGMEVPSKEYFKAGGYWPGVSDETPTATNVQDGATGGGNVVRLNVQRGSTAGSSTLQPSEFNFSAFEGKVLNTPDGKRVRIVNGKQVPL
jgi:flagellar motor protein MotB